MRTAWALMVIPRSRSRSMASRTWACISRALRAPVNSSNRSERVDLPWSMWAMMAKLRMWLLSMGGWRGKLIADECSYPILPFTSGGPGQYNQCSILRPITRIGCMFWAIARVLWSADDRNDQDHPPIPNHGHAGGAAAAYRVCARREKAFYPGKISAGDRPCPEAENTGRHDCNRAHAGDPCTWSRTSRSAVVDRPGGGGLSERRDELPCRQT